MAEQRSHAVGDTLRFTPDLRDWAEVLRRNLRAVGDWDFEVGGVHVGHYRAQVRQVLLDASAAYSDSRGIAHGLVGGAGAPILATGHQPELFHPGVWVKYFALQRLAEQDGASAVDVMVDSDIVEVMGMKAPCLTPSPRACLVPLAVEQGGCFACTPAPSPESVAAFRDQAVALARGLDATGGLESCIRRFCDSLDEARGSSTDLGELLTRARRGFEGDRSQYGELPVTGIAHSEPYLRFVAHVLLDLERFSAAYNSALDEYRVLNKTRSKAQPFPNLRREGETLESPFWLLGPNGRESLQLAREGRSLLLTTQGGFALALPDEVESCVRALVESGARIVPKALTLTMFVRMFFADLFIHGTGGGRYDAVTDEVAEKYFGVRPPEFVVATADFRLPVEVPEPVETEITEVKDRLNRLEHNPDIFVQQAELPEELRREAVALVERKNELVAQIASADADKKAVGLEIKQVNRSLAQMLEPVRAQAVEELRDLEERQRSREVLTDRSYSYFLWSPDYVARIVSSA